jgi:hypothetical protein
MQNLNKGGGGRCFVNGGVPKFSEFKEIANSLEIVSQNVVKW